MSELKNYIETKIKELAVIHDELATEMEVRLPKAIGNLIKAHNESESPNKLESIHWSQYVPYFNDGDPCEFRLTDVEWSLVSDTENEYLISEEVWTGRGYEPNPNYDSLLRNLINEVSELINLLPEETLLSIFECDVTVTINENGDHETDEYDHD